MTEGEQLERILNLDKRSHKAIAKACGVDRITLERWTKREFLLLDTKQKLKKAGIDFDKLAKAEMKNQDVRIGANRFVHVMYPDNITDKEIDRLLATFKLWKQE